MHPYIDEGLAALERDNLVSLDGDQDAAERHHHAVDADGQLVLQEFYVASDNCEIGLGREVRFDPAHLLPGQHFCSSFGHSDTHQALDEGVRIESDRGHVELDSSH